MKLRPHHLLCIRFYKGHGYSEEFNRNMKEILTRLFAGEAFTVTSGLDDLCSACPNRIQDENGKWICNAEEKVSRYDRKTHALLSLEEGKPYGYSEINKLSDTLIFDCGKFDDICADCEWKYLCV